MTEAERSSAQLLLLVGVVVVVLLLWAMASFGPAKARNPLACIVARTEAATADAGQRDAAGTSTPAGVGSQGTEPSACAQK